MGVDEGVVTILSINETETGLSIDFRLSVGSRKTDSVGKLENSTNVLSQVNSGLASAGSNTTIDSSTFAQGETVGESLPHA